MAAGTAYKPIKQLIKNHVTRTILPGESPQSHLSPRSGVPVTLVAPGRHPSHIRPGESSQSHLAPRRGVPVTFSRENRPSHICCPGEASQSHSPRRGVLPSYITHLTECLYSRTKYLSHRDQAQQESFLFGDLSYYEILRTY
jgi:hypothetical protein